MTVSSSSAIPGGKNPSSARPSFVRRHRGKIILAGLLIIPALLLSLYTMVVLSISYSTGERAGFVQKLSKRGWICPTWEGELALVHMPGSTPELFQFSIRDDAVAQQVNQLQGKRAALSYEQKKGLPTSCFGETEYFVTAAKPIVP
jgi:hypothetical protein